MKFLFVILTFTSLLLTACGQSGNLYLPNPTTDKQHAKDTYLLKNNKTTNPTKKENTTQDNSKTDSNSAVSQSNSKKNDTGSDTSNNNAGISATE